MTPTVDHLTTAEQAEHYARLITSALPALDRHAIGRLARRYTDYATLASQFHHAYTQHLIRFAARVRTHADILRGVRIGRRGHSRPSPDGDTMAALAEDLRRVLIGQSPMH